MERQRPTETTDTTAPTGQTIVFADVSVVRDGAIALRRVTATLSERRIGVVGLNGSGKSTLLKAIVGLVAPSEGTIAVDGRDAVTEARAVRATTGLLFQNPDSQIVFPIVGDDLAFGLKNHGVARAEVGDRVATTLERLGIARLAERRIHELSGGEKQLVALAGLLVIEPKTLLFDEPTSQLDLKNRNRLRGLLADLPQQAIVASHDLELLADFDRVLVIEAGRIVFDGAPAAAIAAHIERSA